MVSKTRKSDPTPSQVFEYKTWMEWKGGPAETPFVQTFSALGGYVNESVAYENHKGPPYLEGGPFDLRRYRLDRTGFPVSIKGAYDYGSYINYQSVSGTAFPDFGPLGLYISPSESQLQANVNMVRPPSPALQTYGEKALDRLNPTKLSKSSVAQALIELYHDGVPKLPLKELLSAKRFRNAGSEYLNVVFGWRPLLQDIRQVYETYTSIEKLYQQLVRDNGKKVRRSATLLKDRSVESKDSGSSGPIWPPGWYSVSPGTNTTSNLHKTTTTTTRVWAVGAGSYYIPNIASVEFKDNFRHQLYGDRINPYVLWQVMPWSWLIDWFTNIGDLIQYHLPDNLATFVWDYAYLMRSHKTEISYVSDSVRLEFWPRNGTNTLLVPSGSARELFETKERIPATPYGFGIQLSSLSAKQLAILSALGISRTRF